MNGTINLEAYDEGVENWEDTNNIINVLLFEWAEKIIINEEKGKDVMCVL